MREISHHSQREGVPSTVSLIYFDTYQEADHTKVQNTYINYEILLKQCKGPHTNPV